MTRLVNYPADELLNRMSYWDFDNFSEFLGQTEKYTVLGGAAQGNGVGNPVSMVSTGDNVDAGLVLAKKPMQFRDGKPISMAGALTLDEQTTTAQVNAWFGFTNKTVETDILANNGGGIPADFHGAGFYAVDGKSNLHCVASVGTNQTIVELSDANKNNELGRAVLASSTSERQLKIEVRDRTSTRQVVVFWVDNVVVASIDIDPTGGAMMGPAVMVKSGSVTAQTGVIPWWGYAFTR